MTAEQLKKAIEEIVKGISWKNSSITPKTVHNKEDWDELELEFERLREIGDSPEEWIMYLYSDLSPFSRRLISGYMTGEQLRIAMPEIVAGKSWEESSISPKNITSKNDWDDLVRDYQYSRGNGEKAETWFRSIFSTESPWYSRRLARGNMSKEQLTTAIAEIVEGINWEESSIKPKTSKSKDDWDDLVDDYKNAIINGDTHIDWMNYLCSSISPYYNRLLEGVSDQNIEEILEKYKIGKYKVSASDDSASSVLSVIITNFKNALAKYAALETSIKRDLWFIVAVLISLFFIECLEDSRLIYHLTNPMDKTLFHCWIGLEILTFGWVRIYKQDNIAAFYAWLLISFSCYALIVSVYFFPHSQDLGGLFGLILILSYVGFFWKDKGGK